MIGEQSVEPDPGAVIEPLDMLAFMAQELQELGTDLAEKMDYIVTRIGNYKATLTS